MRLLRAIGVAGLALALNCGPAGARVHDTPEKDAATARASVAALSDAERAQLKGFSDRVNAYAKQVKGLPEDRLSPTADIAKLEQQRKTLRDAIQRARPDAQQGNLFTPEAADVFRKLLRATMMGPAGRRVRASLNHAEPLSPQNVKVNDVYPNLQGQPIQSVPPTLLLNLPPLPRGIEYCISAHSLVVRDVDANLVVDYLPDALP